MAQLVYAMPGSRRTLRHVVRAVLQQSPLRCQDKQRVFNFFARDVSPSEPLRWQVKVARTRKLSLELQIVDDFCRNWYFWGYRGFERGLTCLFERLLPSKESVVDVGANVGYYTFLAASALEGRGMVHAFEPSPDIFPHLQRNSELNEFACLRLNQVALSDVDGEGDLFMPDNAAWTNASLVPGYTPSKRRLRVPLMRFDTYCAAHDLKKVDLLKIDVEGTELQVLRGMGDLLERWRPDIVLEVLQPFAAELDTFFANTPYRKFCIRDDGLREIHRIAADPIYRDVYLTCAQT